MRDGNFLWPREVTNKHELLLYDTDMNMGYKSVYVVIPENACIGVYVFYCNPKIIFKQHGQLVEKIFPETDDDILKSSI